MKTFNKLKIKLLGFLLPFTRVYIPRWVILLIYAGLTLFSIKMAYFLVSTITGDTFSPFHFRWEEAVILGVQLFFFIIFKSFYSLIRYSSIRDAGRQFIVVALCVITLLIINQLYYFNAGRKLILNAGLGIYGVFTFSLLFLFQITVKETYSLLINKNRVLRKYYIYGTEPEEVAIASGLMLQDSKSYAISGFITEHPERAKNKILNLPIYTIEDLEYQRVNVEYIIIGHRKLQRVRNTKNNILNRLLDDGVKIYKIPRLRDWQDISATDYHQLKEIKVEDLLPRFPINLNRKELFDVYCNKVIMVTGAAGSIGSEIVRQAITLRPQKILLVDQAETPMYHLILEIRENYPDVDFVQIIADVRDEYRIEQIFKTYHPKVVFHGAAYKHVPLMEANCMEALSVNFRGTRNVALLSAKYKVERFVFISTDKAVNPTSMMGASKRSAEVYIQHLSKNPEFSTNFITTRFGNVLGSNGSVVPLFQRQITAGGPITVTHPDINRFFMTIDEACQLVLIAGEMGNGGEIFVFDMGEPVKIEDLAKNMIKLAGLTLGRDIEIIYTGLRPGEKLYEEVLADKEKTLPTQNKKILIAKGISPFKINDTGQILKDFLFAIQVRDKQRAVELLHEIVPEYKSDNPEFAAGKQIV